MNPRMSAMAEVARGSLQLDRQHVEGVHVAVEAGDLGGGQVEVVDAQLAGLAQQVVVDVGDVAHAAGLVAAVPQPALEHVVDHVTWRRARGGWRRRA